MSANLLTPGDFDDDRQENRLRQEQERYWQPIESAFYLIEKFGLATHKAYHELERLVSILKEERQDNEDLAYASPKQKVEHYRFLMFLLAAYLISLILIFDSTEYLVSLVARGNSIVQMVGVVLVPLAIIVMQVSIAVDVYLAEQNSLPSLKAKQRTAKVVVLLTPGLILGTFMAEVGNGFWLPGILLLVVRMGLAYITDAYIVSNGKQAYQAKAFFLFRAKNARLLKERDQLQRAIEENAGQTIQHFQECQQNLAAFRNRFPDSPFKLPQISSGTRWTLEHWMGADYELH